MTEDRPPPPRYRPDVFDVQDLDSAKRIILTANKEMTTDERWETETPYLVHEIGRLMAPHAGTCSLDYGCGVGRLAEGLIKRYGCFVLGVDISLAMRQLAPGYVGSDRFAIVSPAMLELLVARGFCCDQAIACWVIQHCPEPRTDLARIGAALVRDGPLLVVNDLDRGVPSDAGWFDDGVSVEALVDDMFTPLSRDNFPEAVAALRTVNGSYIKLVRNTAP